MRALTAKNIYDIKYEEYDFTGIWEEVFGKPEKSGIWLIYGKEKNGKSWAALLISKYIATFERVLYVSAEEGTRKTFRQAIERAGIPYSDNKILFVNYEPLDELESRLRRRNAPRVVVLDNLTIYNEEIKGAGMKQLKQKFPKTHFICVAHEERNEPYTAAAAMAKKLADAIIRTEGLRLFISGRVPGGTLDINQEKAKLYHGN